MDDEKKDEKKSPGVAWEQIISVTSKGQVTLPKEMREALRISDGSKLLAVLDPDGDCIVLKPMLKTSDLGGSMKCGLRSGVVDETER